jgi:hypothetical protein
MITDGHVAAQAGLAPAGVRRMARRSVMSERLAGGSSASDENGADHLRADLERSSRSPSPSIDTGRASGSACCAP